MTNHPTPFPVDDRFEAEEDAIELAVAFNDGKLSAGDAEQVRRRLETDVSFRAVALPVIEALREPPLDDIEFQRRFGDFRRRMGLSARLVDDGIEEFQKRVGKRSSWQRRAMRIAAAVVFAGLALPMGFATFLEYRYWDRFSPPEGTRVSITLPDGSVADLAAGSRIRFFKNMRSRRGTHRREVTLTGDATFRVATIDGPRFVVFTADANVTAVGTEFMVRSLADGTLVTVTEGRVSIQPVDTDTEQDIGNSRVVAAGQSARVRGDSVVVTATSNGARP
jgi:ferric-dicitrate binding protein FerR (iron transport regulator)